MAGVEQLSEQQIQEYQEVFMTLCRVTIADLLTNAERLGIPNNEKDIGIILGNSNVTCQSRLTLETFLVLMARSRKSSQPVDPRRQEEEDMLKAFRAFDRDGNGVIDEKELLSTMQSLGEKLSKKDVKAMIKSADKNGDGHIDYNEFVRMMYNK